MAQPHRRALVATRVHDSPSHGRRSDQGAPPLGAHVWVATDALQRHNCDGSPTLSQTRGLDTLLRAESTTRAVDETVYSAYGHPMADTTTIRVSRTTHARVTRLAAQRHETVDETVMRAIRALDQDAVARDLAGRLSDDEVAWLNADAG